MLKNLSTNTYYTKPNSPNIYMVQNQPVERLSLYSVFGRLLLLYQGTWCIKFVFNILLNARAELDTDILSR